MSHCNTGSGAQCLYSVFHGAVVFVVLCLYSFAVSHINEGKKKHRERMLVSQFAGKTIQFNNFNNLLIRHFNFSGMILSVLEKKMGCDLIVMKIRIKCGSADYTS